MLEGQLKTLLDKMQSEVNEYLTLLRQEHELLQKEDVNSIDELRAQKDQLIDQMAHYDTAIGLLINQHAEQIQSVIEAKGLEANQKMSALIELCDETERVALAQCWAKIRPQLAECQKLHSINGAVMMSRLNSIKRTLNLMMHGKEESADVYTEAG